MNTKTFPLFTLLLAVTAFAPARDTLAQSTTVNAVRVTASAKVGAKNYALTPNQIGQFQRLNIKANATIPVEVAYPDGQPGDKVSLRALDGGRFEDQSQLKAVTLDVNKKLTFTFTVNAEPGIYRVGLSRGQDLKVLDFWVGDPHLQANRENK